MYEANRSPNCEDSNDLPLRNSALLRWCMANELRVVQPMTLMSTGLYNDPAGTWLPSIVF